MANYNPRLAKINRSYLVEEIAELYEVHKNTVNNWLKEGLKDCGAGFPRLILGQELREFLENRRRKNKRPCKPGEIYCVCCRMPVSPLNNKIYLDVSESGRASISGQCPCCLNKIFRKVSLSNIENWRGDLELINTQSQKRLSKLA
ncbi:MAG: DNA-binding protein [Gammaproteobacteria bacterium]|nr:DNA-binding protein [Gammaproteobacteria bacterium]|tara:strand:+ start:194667 stop:195104 length:438 start_codon:yes stop_codon:yes gene_type:complete